MNIGDKIIALLKNRPDGMRSIEMRKSIKNPGNSLPAALWKLKKENKIEHDIVTGVYKLTGVNTLAVEVQQSDTPAEVTITDTKAAKPKSKALTVEDRKYAALEAEVVKWESRWKEAMESSRRYERAFFDALAVVKYLETKLQIQHDA